MKTLAITLARRPQGHLRPDDFARTESDLPEPEQGQLRVEVLHLSVDPWQRGALDAQPFVGLSVPPGGIIPGRGIARVLESQAPGFAPGDIVTGDLGWRNRAVVAAEGMRKLEPGSLPMTWHLGVLGTPGITALLALDRIAAPVAGETVLVTSAAGTVGSTAAQLAKARGCRVIGVAGGPEKVRYLTQDLGLDHAIDRRAVDDIAAAVALVAPRGIDTLFDNVGGQMLDGLLTCMNPLGRIILCGFLAGYDGGAGLPPLHNHMLLSTRRLRMEGFSVRDHLSDHAGASRHLAAQAASGLLRQRETVFEGLETAPSALIALLGGRTIGKVIVNP